MNAPAPVMNEAMQAEKTLAEARERLQSVRRSVVPFAAIAAQDATALGPVTQILADGETTGMPIRVEYDPEAEWPAEFDLGIIPCTKRADGATVTVAIVLAPLPNATATLAADGGEAWVAERVTDLHLAKLANLARPKLASDKADERDGPLNLPRTVADFIINQRELESPEGFKAVAPAFVAALHEANMVDMTEAKLQRCLAVSAEAETAYPNNPSESWDGLLDKMIAAAITAGKNPGIMRVWKTTRRQTQVSQASFTLDALDAALAAQSGDNG